jgi:hypothetical protein
MPRATPDNDYDLGRHSELHISHAWLKMMKWRSKKLQYQMIMQMDDIWHRIISATGAVLLNQVNGRCNDLISPLVLSSWQSIWQCKRFFIHINFYKSHAKAILKLAVLVSILLFQTDSSTEHLKWLRSECCYQQLSCSYPGNIFIGSDT